MCQVALRLQDERVGGRAQGILFLLSVERLLRKLTAFECGLHARTILSDGELCVANLDSYLVLELLRVWTVSSLGPYWTTRIISVANAPLVRRGPYRFMRHPNYLIVIAEIAVLPLAFGATAIAAVFSAANLLLLARRLMVEERALAPRRGI